ncbi:MAG: anthranilate synthase component I family protein [Muribaculaceae bacterium]|nr:anthranilate synthase component I family protein [Muribaculaceae bacterium]
MKTVTTLIPADLETPVGIYLKIRDIYPQSALLESSDYHTTQNSISLIGVDPIGHFKVINDEIEELSPDGKITRTPATPENVMLKLKEYTEGFKHLALQGLTNGLLGYTAYDSVKYFEPSVPVSSSCPEFKNIPDIFYILYRFIIQMNHFRNEMNVIENIPDGEDSMTPHLLSVLKNNNVPQYGFFPLNDLSSSMTDEDFMKIVEKCVEHCKRGDVFQIVPSRRFSEGFKGDDFNVYRALRSINPSPYLFYFDFGAFRVFGSSPETHLRVQDGYAYIDPIAGTFKRTGDDTKDRELAEALLEDEKENAEHVMLVDLARNDLSRSGGKVSIDFMRQIQFYSHVIHMVSRVKAKLPAGADIYALFASTFPAGTLSGAPKVRAMQIINQLEPHTRKIYGGCLGYLGFDGSLNQAITIRTFISTGNRLYSQAGAGIVAHSNPATELQETNNKLGALRRAVETASRFNP